MFCIASFIVFAVLAVFSASYRPLVAKAWHCVIRRVTLRPCDISFGEEVKGRLIGRYVVSHPRFARFLSRWIDWISFAFVLLSLWSVWAVAMTGLNLWVYDTCNPKSSEACSLSGEACGVEQASLGLAQAVSEGRLAEWAITPAADLATTLMRVPDRLKTWNAAEYLVPTSTFATPRDERRPDVLEVIDPSCKFCKKLTHNLQAAGARDSANVTYLLYPILLPDGTAKFPHSVRLAQYIEAAKTVPLGDATEPGDWRLLDRLFTGDEATADDLQTRINIGSTAEDVERLMTDLLQGIGYTPQQVALIQERTTSTEVAEALLQQRRMVEDEIRTIKIPTLIIAGRRYDRVVDTDKLQSLLRP